MVWDGKEEVAVEERECWWSEMDMRIEANISRAGYLQVPGCVRYNPRSNGKDGRDLRICEETMD